MRDPADIAGDIAILMRLRAKASRLAAMAVYHALPHAAGAARDGYTPVGHVYAARCQAEAAALHRAIERAMVAYETSKELAMFERRRRDKVTRFSSF